MRRTLLLLLVVSGCGLGQPYARVEVCEDAAAAVAARVEACTGDAATGRAARDGFTAEVACTPEASELETVRLYECVDAMNDQQCTQVMAHSADWQAWLDVSPLCEELLFVGEWAADSG
jgi:hypothetical protein